MSRCATCGDGIWGGRLCSNSFHLAGRARYGEALQKLERHIENMPADPASLSVKIIKCGEVWAFDVVGWQRDGSLTLADAINKALDKASATPPGIPDSSK